jgi:tetratricopeptide (TPR) repeat protein
VTAPVEAHLPNVTDGVIAVINFEAARGRAWTKYWDAQQIDVAEAVVEHERAALQLLGDTDVLDRLETLDRSLERSHVASFRAALVRARIASLGHRFADARDLLANAHGEHADDAARLSLAIDVACGDGVPAILERRRRLACSGSFDDLFALGVALAERGAIDEASDAYERALQGYRDVSPLNVAWVCFQLGVLWGEVAPTPHRERAKRWYERAIAALPAFVAARVHLAELSLHEQRSADAHAVLTPVRSSDDPELSWRLSDAHVAAGEIASANAELARARDRFDALLRAHELAYADHAAEFFLERGDDPARALALAARAGAVRARRNRRTASRAGPMIRREFIVRATTAVAVPALARIPAGSAPAALADPAAVTALTIAGWEDAASAPADAIVLSLGRSWRCAWR